MRKSSVAILSLSLLLGTSAFALAADAKQTATDMKPAAGDMSKTETTTTKMTTKKTMAHTMAKGEVASVDDAGKSFVVHPKTGADMTLKVNDKTTYTMDGKKATWADVKAGVWAGASYKNDGTDNWAMKVALKTPMAKPAAK